MERLTKAQRSTKKRYLGMTVLLLMMIVASMDVVLVLGGDITKAMESSARLLFFTSFMGMTFIVLPIAFISEREDDRVALAEELDTVEANMSIIYGCFFVLMNDLYPKITELQEGNRRCQRARQGIARILLTLCIAERMSIEMFLQFRHELVVDVLKEHFAQKTPFDYTKLSKVDAQLLQFLHSKQKAAGEADAP